MGRMHGTHGRGEECTRRLMRKSRECGQLGKIKRELEEIKQRKFG